MVRLAKWLIVSLFSVLTGGCSYLESYFPDKERDYQYTSEIPMLNWPAEIRPSQQVNSGEPSLANDNPASEVSSATASEDNNNASQANASSESSSSEMVNSENDDRTSISSVEIVRYDDGESRLRLGSGYSKSWRAVSKALSRNAIEVTERNHEQGLITLQYDPNEKKAEDNSYWDELGFIFHGIDTNEEEYRLKLEERNGQTDVLVLDSESVPMLNNANAVRLLKVISDTIKADLAGSDKQTHQPESVTPAQ